MTEEKFTREGEAKSVISEALSYLTTLEGLLSGSSIDWHEISGLVYELRRLMNRLGEIAEK